MPNVNQGSTSIRKSPILRPALQATPPSSTDSRYCRAGKAGVGVNSSIGVWAGDTIKTGERMSTYYPPKSARVIVRQEVRVTFLTFGPSQHKAKTLAVFFLQEHRLLLDYVVTGREGTETVRNRTGLSWQTGDQEVLRIPIQTHSPFPAVYFLTASPEFLPEPWWRKDSMDTGQWCCSLPRQRLKLDAGKLW